MDFAHRITHVVLCTLVNIVYMANVAGLVLLIELILNNY